MAGTGEKTPLLSGGGAKPGMGRKNPSYAGSMESVEENYTGTTQTEWRKRKTLYFICYCLSAIVGLIIAVVVNEALWYSAVGFDTMDNGITTGLKIMVFVSSFFAIVFVFLHYDAMINFQRSQGVELTSGMNLMALYESRHLWMFLWDVFILIPQPFPFVHFTVCIPDLHHLDEPTCYTSDNIWVALMFLRVTLLPRLVAELMLRGKDMAYVMARLGNVELNTWFVMRALFIANFGAVLALIGSAVLATAYLVLLAERPYPHVDELADFDSCLWMTLITMTTVGYGDVVAQTRLGRFVSALVACMGVVTVSLVINGVVARMKMDPREQRIIDWIDKSAVKTQLRNAASHVIQVAVRQYNANCRMLAAGERPKRLRVHPRIRTVLTEFRWAKREASADIGDPDVNMSDAVENIQERVQRLESMVEEIHRAIVPRQTSSAGSQPSPRRE